jgi:hypothetical protein
LYRLLSKTMTSLEVDPGCSARTSLRAVLHLEKKCHEFRGFCERAYHRREWSGMSSTTNVRERCFSRRHQNTKEGGGHEALDSPGKKTIITNDVLTLGALGSGWNVYVIYRARPRKEMRSQRRWGM